MKKLILSQILFLLAISLPAQNYYNDVVSGRLWVNVNASNGIKIKTNIPAPEEGSNHRNNTSVNIEGFDLTSSTPINLSIVWKMWNSPTFTNYSVTSFGSFNPDVYLGIENNLIVIWMDQGQLNHDLHIRAHSMYYNDSSWFESWTIVNENITNAINTVKLPYKNSTNAYYPSVQRGKVWVNRAASYGIKFSTNIPISPTGSFTRHDMLFIIEGYDKSSVTPFKIDLFWSMWDGPDFDYYKAVSYGTYNPEIRLALENDKIVFWINEEGKSVHTAFHIRAYAGTSNNTSWFDNWTIENAPLNDINNSLIVPYAPLSDKDGSSLWDINQDDISYSDGNVSIGTTQIPSGYRLAVDGKIIVEEANVQLSENWPDYVFGKDFELTPIQEIKRYVLDHKHLPEIPTEAEVIEEGINVGQMSTKLLKKVEELTLYLIEQNEQTQKQRIEIDELKKEIDSLKTK